MAVEVALKLVAWASSVPEAVGREVVAAAGAATILVRILRQELTVPDPGALDVAEQPLGQV